MEDGRDAVSTLAMPALPGDAPRASGGAREVGLSPLLSRAGTPPGCGGRRAEGPPRVPGRPPHASPPGPDAGLDLSHVHPHGAQFQESSTEKNASRTDATARAGSRLVGGRGRSSPPACRGTRGGPPAGRGRALLRTANARGAVREGSLLDGGRLEEIA